VKGIRERLGLTQVGLAERLGVSFVTVSRWENGKVEPSGLALQRLRALAAPPKPPAEATNPVQRPDFLGDPNGVRLVVESERLSYGYLANPAFAIETSRIDPLPHQRIAVYEHMLPQEKLRFLLADDAGAGKTIMAGLYIREMIARRLVRRILIVPPAGLIGNWVRELRRFFGLEFTLVRGSDLREGNPFTRPDSGRVVCSLDTLAGISMFSRLQAADVEPYDLVVFDEAHKLSARQEPDLTIEKTDRYRLAEALAGISGDDPRWMLDWSARHLLLLTATPHMGKAFPYYALWRLLEPDTLGAFDAFAEYSHDRRRTHFIRRTKEEMVDLSGAPLYKPRHSDTLGFTLSQGTDSEQELYDRTTAYMRGFYNKAGILNASAARLAQSVFQRRLASSTYALLRSFERRLERLDEFIQQVRDGRLNDFQIRAALQHLRDPFESTADEDADETGREAHEADEDRLFRLIRSTSLQDLQTERREVDGLLALARRVLAKDQDAKFAALREVLLDERFRGQKLIIFTEHRDTLTWLRHQLEALGFTDRIAAIHGGLDFRQRESEVERFAMPVEQGGAQYLLATDAAGEGINLQFCWLMVNYDIPWNPARLEQRMGRIHRYGQKRDVFIVNLVATSTREGRVLGTLLHKLEDIRREMGNDKVFDVIGSVLDGVSMIDFMAEALTDEGANNVAAKFGGLLTKEQISSLEARRRQIYGDGGDVARELPRLRAITEREALQRLLPGYVRQFIMHASQVLDLRITGDLDAFFVLAPGRSGSVDPLWEILDHYPPEARTRLTVYRPSVGEPAIFLHPGEPVFESLRDIVRDRCGEAAMRGAAFEDPTTTEASVVFAVETAVLQRKSDSGGSGATTLESLLRLVRVTATGQVDSLPLEHLLLLRPADRFPAQHASLAMRASELQARALDYVDQQVARAAIEERRAALRESLYDRERELVRGYDFQAAELAAMRARLTEKVTQGQSALKPQLDRVKTRQRALDARRRRAVDEMRQEPDTLFPGPVRVLALALLSPVRSAAARESYDADVEHIAVELARAWEEACGAKVHDVSTPPKARAAGLTIDHPGYDLLAVYPSGEQRAIEVKGRAAGGQVDVSENEWARACNLRQGYWLYAAYDCASPMPRLIRVQDPFQALLVKARGGVLINESDIVAAGEPS
jgi:superfamily II DNA or RNA helicase